MACDPANFGGVAVCGVAASHGTLQCLSMAYIFQPARDALKNNVGRYSDLLSGKILDVGAGSFDRYSKLFKNASKYVRMDIEGTENVDVHGRAEALPFPDASFDGIVCTQTLCDVFDLDTTFKEFNRVLTKGGRVLSTTPFLSMMTDEPYYFWNPSPYALRKLYEDDGFKIIVLEPTAGAHETIANLRIRVLIDDWKLYDRWYGRFVSYVFIFWTKLARRKDRRDGKTLAQSRTAIDFIAIAEKC